MEEQKSKATLSYDPVEKIYKHTSSDGRVQLLTAIQFQVGILDSAPHLHSNLYFWMDLARRRPNTPIAWDATAAEVRA